jgi:hypothetical protein
MRITWRAPVNLAKSIIRAIRWRMAKKRILAPSYIVQARLDECNGGGLTDPCVHYDADSRQCRLCECFVGAKAMVWFEKCPDDRWEV